MGAGFTKLASLGLSKLKDAAPQDRAALHDAAKQATANFEKAKQRFNYNHPNLYLSLGIALAYQSRYQEAASKLNDYFAEVKKLENHLSSIASKCDAGFNRLNAEGYQHLGFIYDLESEFEANEQRKAELINKAIEQFNQAVKLKQDYASVYGMLGSMYWSQNKSDEAISQYKKAILFETDDSARATWYRSLGSVYSQKGNADEALKHVREAIRLNPNNPSFYESLASIYVAQNKLEETLEALNKATALRTEPTANPGPYYYLGVTYAIRFMQKRNEKDFEEAIRWLKKAVEIKPNEAMYYQALGTSYKKAIEYDPKNPNPYFDMADIYANLKHNKDAAIEALKKAIELKPDYAKAYRSLGINYYHKDNVTEAVKQLLKAIEIDPKYLQAYIDLAEIYKAQKNYPEAIKYFERATELSPTEFYSYKELAKIYEAQQKNEVAVRYYEEAINRLSADDSSTKNLYLGRIARLKGQYAEAIEYFRKVNFPDEPGQAYYEIGVLYVVSKNKSAALEQHRQLVQLKSPLADELLKRIKEMK
jgi:tetratricopeptide (TPR) repeat protein